MLKSFIITWNSATVNHVKCINIHDTFWIFWEWYVYFCGYVSVWVSDYIHVYAHEGRRGCLVFLSVSLWLFRSAIFLWSLAYYVLYYAGRQQAPLILLCSPMLDLWLLLCAVRLACYMGAGVKMGVLMSIYLLDCLSSSLNLHKLDT